MKKLLLVVLLCTGLLVGVFAQETLHRGAGIAFTQIPGWKITFMNFDSCTMYSPDGTVGMNFYVIQSDTMDEVLKEVMENTLKTYPNVVFGNDPVDLDINGLKLFILDGNSITKGRNTGISLAIIINPAVSAVTDTIGIITFASTPEGQKYMNDVYRFRDTMRAVPSAEE